MKKILALVTMFMFCIGMGAQTETSLINAYQIYVTGQPAQANTSAELMLSMKNRNAIGTWKCTLSLPEGVTFKSATLVDANINRYPDGYNAELQVTKNNDGTVISFLCEGEEGVALTGNDGPIAVVTVDIARTVAPGDYDVVVSGVTLYETNGITGHDHNGNTFTWTIEEAVVEQSTITFDTDGGTEINPITQDVGTPVTPPANPTKEGYEFVGWEPAIPDVMPENDLTVTAQWKVIYYSTEFYLDEGGELYEGQEIAFGNPLIVPVDPTREGYTFTGWKPEVPETMPSHDMTFVAQWQINSYLLTFVIDNDIIYSAQVEYGSDITAPDAPEREGYTFAGWDEYPATMPAHDVNVQGSYNANRYKVTYVLDETGVAYAEYDDVVFGSDVPAPEVAPTREGYTFTGWEPEVPETMPSHDLTFVAQWEINKYNVEVRGEFAGYVTVSNLNPEFGETVTVTVQNVPDYEFVGLIYEAENGNSSFIVSEMMPNNTFTVENVRSNFAIEALYNSLFETIALSQEYMPFSCSKSLDFTDSGLTAYIATDYFSYGGNGYVVLQEINVVPEHTGVLLFGEVGETGYKVPYVKQQMTAVDGNLLVPFLEGEWLSPFDGNGNQNYVLDLSRNAFVLLTDNGIPMTAPSAYLSLPADEEVNVVFFGDKETIDGISHVQQGTGEDAIFDMQGRRVGKAVKGIYIVNGKKVAVK